MVTFELAVGILAACLVTGLLGWGIALVGLQARCAEVASQVARQIGRGDPQAASEARRRAPDGAIVTVDENTHDVEVTVLVEARWGAFGPVEVRGRAVAPAQGR